MEKSVAVRVSVVAAAVLSLPLAATATAAETDGTIQDARLLASLDRWARNGRPRAAGLTYVELPAAGRPLDWRFVRIADRREKVRLVGVACRGNAATCRLERLGLAEERDRVAGLLSASARALALRQRASAFSNAASSRRALVFSDGCHEISRTFAEPLSSELQALFVPLAALADRVFKEGAAAPEDPVVGRPIGDATMRRDGQLVLNLVAESPQGDHGLAQFTYSLTDKDYARTLVHIGGICPGRRGRIVPPWPECGR
jgi:hypothetical protein